MLVLALLSGIAHAETSSWLFRDPTAPSRPARAKEARAPQTGVGLNDNSSTHVKSNDAKKDGAPAANPAAPELGPTVPPAGKDDAFLAFDQGRYLTALKLAEELAKKGDPLAHTLIARIHDEGLGVPKNPSLAAQWYKRAAELGDVNAAFAYGAMLAEGRGVEKDRTAAGAMFERAARTGHAAANYNVP